VHVTVEEEVVLATQLPLGAVPTLAVQVTPSGVPLVLASFVMIVVSVTVLRASIAVTEVPSAVAVIEPTASLGLLPPQPDRQTDTIMATAAITNRFMNIKTSSIPRHLYMEAMKGLAIEIRLISRVCG
jgi:hypothetical protein